MNVQEAVLKELKRLSKIIRSCGDDDYAIQYGIESALGIAKSTGCLEEVIGQFMSIAREDEKCSRLLRSYWHFRNSGCGATLKKDQWWIFCGERSLGKTAMCKECGGEFEREQ